MSKYLAKRLAALEAYVPGEQPQDKKYVKLNTNESPFPPSPFATRLARQAAAGLNLYCDPECRTLTEVAADAFGVKAEQLIFTNGSDEVLDFAFLAFCDETAPAVFPDITYGFYPVFAAKDGVPFREIPLTNDLRVRVEDYLGVKGTIFLANPNAPTGVALGRAEIERIVAQLKGQNGWTVNIFAMRSSATFLSPDMFEEYAWPALKSMIEGFHAAGLHPIIHADGKWLPMLEYFTQLPKGCMHIELDGDTDMQSAFDILGGWQCIQGNVPATMLMMAQPDEVSEYCEKLIKMGMNGGFILGSGCEVPMNAKPENVAALIASVR